MADLEVPVLVLAGANDSIAPTGSVKALVPKLTGAGEARFEIVPGGHLGMLTGRRARTGTWPLIDSWVDEWTTSEEEPAIGTNPARRHRSAGSRALRR